MFAANVGGIDRALRLVGGAVLLALGLWMKLGAVAPRGTLLVIIGLLLLFTGTIRFCILYVPFGFSTARRRPEQASSAK